MPWSRSRAHASVGGHADGQVRLRTLAQTPLEMLGQNMPGGHSHQGDVGSTTADAAGENCGGNSGAGAVKGRGEACQLGKGSVAPHLAATVAAAGRARTLRTPTLQTRGTVFPMAGSPDARPASLVARVTSAGQGAMAALHPSSATALLRQAGEVGTRQPPRHARLEQHEHALRRNQRLRLAGGLSAAAPVALGRLCGRAPPR